MMGKLSNGFTHTLLIAVSLYVLGMDIHLDATYFTEFHKDPCWGPILYLLYTAPLSDVIKEHNMSYHFYADDTQINMSLQPSSCIVTLDEIRSKIEACVSDINEWMMTTSSNSTMIRQSC